MSVRMVNYCPNCGKQFAASDEYCSKCGENRYESNESRGGTYDCKYCGGNGRGHQGRSVTNTCDVCDGRGVVNFDYDVRSCNYCGGNGRGHQGRSVSNTCDVCSGTGYVPY